MRRLPASALLVALFAACAGGAGPGGRTTLRWATSRDPTGGDEKIAAAFEAANPTIDVEIVAMPMDVGAQHDAYVNYLAAGDASIDLYALDVIWTAEFASAGWLRPADAVVDGLGRDGFLDAPLGSATYEGTVWAVPWFTDCGLLYARSDLLAAAGLVVPETWDDLLHAATRLKTREVAGLAFQAEQYEGLVCDFLEIARAFGGDALDAAGRPRLDTPENARALAFMKRLVDEAAPEGVLAHKEEEARRLFTEGRAAFMRNWPYAAKIARDPSASSVVDRFVVGPPPAGPAGRAATLGGWNVAVSAFSRHVEAAERFSAFLASPEAQRILAIDGGRLPTRREAYEDPAVLERAPLIPTFLPALETARPRPVHPRYALISDELQTALHAALSGRATPEAALAEAQRAIEAALD